MAIACIPTASVSQLAFDQGWGKTSRQGQAGLNFEHAFEPGCVLRADVWGELRSSWNPIPSRIIDLHRRASGMRSEYKQSALLVSRTLYIVLSALVPILCTPVTVPWPMALR